MARDWTKEYFDLDNQMSFNFNKLTRAEVARYMLLNNYFKSPRVMTAHNKDLLKELQNLTFRALRSITK